MTPLRLLQVEDTQDDAALIERALARAGYDVLARRVDSAEALRRELHEAEWDLVIADYTMPGFSGTKALAIVREQHPDLPFIFVSGTIGEDTAVAAMRTGAHDYIMKDNLKRLAPAVEQGAARSLGQARTPPGQPARRLSRLPRLAHRPAQPRVVPRSAAAGDPALASR